MAEPLVLVDLAQTCGACPSQWEARTTPDGRYVYIRYRHGWLTVGVGANDDDAVDQSMMKPYVCLEWDDGGSGGRMTTAEMLELTGFTVVPASPKEDTHADTR